MRLFRGIIFVGILMFVLIIGFTASSLRRGHYVLETQIKECGSGSRTKICALLETLSERCLDGDYLMSLDKEKLDAQLLELIARDLPVEEYAFEHKMKYIYNKESFEVVSAGMDGEFRTEDDMIGRFEMNDSGHRAYYIENGCTNILCDVIVED